MNRTLRAAIAVVLVGIITFSVISICQNSALLRAWKIDITRQKLYTLSEGTKKILGRLNQPITLKLYYAKTAALKGPDQIRFYNNYYQYVRDLLEEYAAASGGMVDLQVIDPRPYSDDEQQALRYGLRRLPITEEEYFFFGLVAQTQFGVIKSIPLFSPERMNFVEYDISYLIDTAVTRQKQRIGVLSSLEVMGDEASPYMMQMMQMQGQRPRPAWSIIRQLRNQYDVKVVESDTEEIKNEDVDLLLVIHPKELPEKTLFAIDQFILRGGRAIVCVDPFCMTDQPDPLAQMRGRMPQSPASDLNRLMRKWGVEMPRDTYAGDKNLAILAALRENQRPEKVIGALDLVPTGGCLNRDNVITADLGQVRVLFAGVLEKVNDKPQNKDKDQESKEKTEGKEKAEQDKENARQNELTLTPLLQTTGQGNTWKPDSTFELMMVDPERLMSHFKEGTEPVMLGYLITGRFYTAFPQGIDVPEEENKPADDTNSEAGQAEQEKKTRHLTGLEEGQADGAVAVFSDVDFISDLIAFRETTFFGTTVVGDNCALLMNTIENLLGSGELIAMRSRGSFARRFTRVDEIEKQVQQQTSAAEEKIEAEIAQFQDDLNKLLSTARSQDEAVVAATQLNQKKEELQRQLREKQINLRKIHNESRQSIEQLKMRLEIFNILAAPAVILLIAIVVGIRRGIRRRRYISHASDA